MEIIVNVSLKGFRYQYQYWILENCENLIDLYPCYEILKTCKILRLQDNLKSLWLHQGWGFIEIMHSNNDCIQTIACKRLHSNDCMQSLFECMISIKPFYSYESPNVQAQDQENTICPDQTVVAEDQSETNQSEVVNEDQSETNHSEVVNEDQSETNQSETSGGLFNEEQGMDTKLLSIYNSNKKF